VWKKASADIVWRDDLYDMVVASDRNRDKYGNSNIKYGHKRPLGLTQDLWLKMWRWETKELKPMINTIGGLNPLDDDDDPELKLGGIPLDPADPLFYARTTGPEMLEDKGRGSLVGNYFYFGHSNLINCIPYESDSFIKVVFHAIHKLYSI
jgi:hypothetical protein